MKGQDVCQRVNDASARAKVQAHRERLRARGYRSMQIWVPDVRSAAFRAEARRQSLAVAHGANAASD